MTESLHSTWIAAAHKKAAVFLGLSLVLCFSGASLSTAQVIKIGSGRKVVRSVSPEYPQSLKDMRIGGTVRLQLTVLANGDVSKVEPRGGNPILVEAATKAVLKWKYVPAGSQSNEEVQIDFRPY